ncbi:MAG: OmpA family protein [Alphaproteobacteria bacterium]|nr:OmpA family protein [Alphaproteobacteria bacterium]
MKNKNCAAVWVVSRVLMVAGVVGLAACTGSNDVVEYTGPIATPTVDYVESLDVYSAPHKDSFLNQLAMNYRSYAIYNARTSGYSEMGELFANKAVAAFSGEVPFPETMENWPVENEQDAFELKSAYDELMEQLKNDASYLNPELAAEAQAKYDCWLSATASGQVATAQQCRERFNKTMVALRDCQGGKIVKKAEVATPKAEPTTVTKTTQTYYPDTRKMMIAEGRAREGVIIVNNVNVPEHLIQPVPVQSAQPLIFNQYIAGGDKTVNKTTGTPTVIEMEEQAQIPQIGDELVSREEFVNMMMAMRAELKAINDRLDALQAASGEKTMIKVQQIPLEPQQHVMEEVFEIRFDFNKSIIKPEYQELIKKLASATQENKNIKVSVVGHTDTAGSSNYNYALGGRRAEAVQKMLIEYGIPSSHIVAVSAGEEDLAVPTPDHTPNADNRRVRVVKEVHYTEPAKPVPMAIEVEEYTVEECAEYGCGQ